MIRLIGELSGKIWEWTQQNGAVGKDAALVGEGYYVWRRN